MLTMSCIWAPVLGVSFPLYTKEELQGLVTLL